MLILNQSQRRNGARAVALILGAALFGGCDRNSPDTEAPVGKSGAAQSVTFLPFSGQAFSLLADDIDGNGLVDVALTSHGAGFTQAFLQSEPRKFKTGPRIEAVAFHPGELIRVPGPERRYVMLSEGINRIQVMTPTDDGGLEVAGALESPTPRVGTFFDWPGTGLGLAVAPFGEAALDVLTGFDAKTPAAAGSDHLPFRPKIAHVDNIAAGDIDGDKIEELLFVNPVHNSVSIVRRPKEGESPKIEELWRCDGDCSLGLVFPADIDQDGDTDLILPDKTEGLKSHRTAINVLVNNGSGAFDVREITFPGRSRAEGGMTGIRGLGFGIDRDKHSYILAAGYEELVLMRFPSSWSGAAPEMRIVKLPKRQAIPVVRLQDLDGDGWLDAIVARLTNDNGGMIIYGPLWELFNGITTADITPAD